MAALCTAVLLDQAGYDVWDWSDQALLRIGQWLQREGQFEDPSSAVMSHVSWIPNFFYGESFDTVPAEQSRTFGYTDWLYP